MCPGAVPEFPRAPPPADELGVRSVDGAGCLWPELPWPEVDPPVVGCATVTGAAEVGPPDFSVPDRECLRWACSRSERAGLVACGCTALPRSDFCGPSVRWCECLWRALPVTVAELGPELVVGHGPTVSP